MIAAFIGIIITICLYLLFKHPSGLPPCPAVPLPGLGNILSLIVKSRSHLSQWRRECGDIFSLYIGNQLLIVLNGYDTIKEALVKNAGLFANRPDLFFSSRERNGQGLIATSGNISKTQRRLTQKIFRELGFAKTFGECKILEEAKCLVKYIEGWNGDKEDFGHAFEHALFNNLCSVMFGKRFGYDSPEMQKMEHAMTQSVSPFVVIWPFLESIPGDLFKVKNMIRTLKEFKESFIKDEIEKHFQNFDGTADDFISGYIKEMKEIKDAGQDDNILKENFAQTVIDLLLAGTDSPLSTMKWLMLFLVLHPEVQEKCFLEIQQNVGMDRQPCLQDRPSLQYIQATIAETQRRGNILPYNIPYTVNDDVVFRGYSFPKGVTVVANMESVLHDPEVWPEPLKFKPERFLDEDGKFCQQEQSIPFSIGRRSCVGDAIGRIELFLLAATLLQSFRFMLPEDEPEPSLEPLLAGTCFPKPYKVRAVPRM